MLVLLLEKRLASVAVSKCPFSSNCRRLGLVKKREKNQGKQAFWFVVSFKLRSWFTPSTATSFIESACRLPQPSHPSHNDPSPRISVQVASSLLGAIKLVREETPPPFFFFLGFAFSNIAFPLNTHRISSSLMFVDGCTSSGHSSLKERVASHPLRMSHHCDSMSKFFLGREETAVSLLGQNRESGNHVDTCQMKKAEVER